MNLKELCHVLGCDSIRYNHYDSRLSLTDMNPHVTLIARTEVFNRRGESLGHVEHRVRCYATHHDVATASDGVAIHFREWLDVVKELERAPSASEVV